MKNDNTYFSNLSQMNFDLSNDQKIFLKKVNDICKLLRKDEEENYLKESINEKVIPFFTKIGMLGCPISKEYGGVGYYIFNFFFFFERNLEKRRTMRNFFFFF